MGNIVLLHLNAIPTGATEASAATALASVVYTKYIVHLDLHAIPRHMLARARPLTARLASMKQSALQDGARIIFAVQQARVAVGRVIIVAWVMNADLIITVFLVNPHLLQHIVVTAVVMVERLVLLVQVIVEVAKQQQNQMGNIVV